MAPSPAARAERLAFAALACAALAFPASAGAVATIGSDLQRAPNAGEDPANGPGRTWALTGGSAPQGASSPINGTIRTLRIRAGASATEVAFRVLRPSAGITWVGAGTSRLVTPAPNAISTFPAGLPIAIGDYLGLNIANSADGFYFVRPSTMSSLQWGPTRLPDGGPPVAPQAGLNEETAIQAEIAPTADFDIDRIKRVKKGRVKVTATFPNAGRLKADQRISRRPDDRRIKPRPLRLKSKTVSVEGPGTVSFRLKLTRFARRQLARNEKLQTKVRLGFRPVFGDPDRIEVRGKRAKLRR